MRIQTDKAMFLFVLERNPQAKNGPFGLLSDFCGKTAVPASRPKRAGYDQNMTGRIFT
jgi:hypothetical protein